MSNPSSSCPLPSPALDAFRLLVERIEWAARERDDDWLAVTAKEARNVLEQTTGAAPSPQCLDLLRKTLPYVEQYPGEDRAELAHSIRNALQAAQGEDLSTQEAEDMRAPDLLQALRDLCEWESHMGGWDAPCWNRAKVLLERIAQHERAAIAPWARAALSFYLHNVADLGHSDPAICDRASRALTDDAGATARYALREMGLDPLPVEEASSGDLCWWAVHCRVSLNGEEREAGEVYVHAPHAERARALASEHVLDTWESTERAGEPGMSGLFVNTDEPQPVDGEQPWFRHAEEKGETVFTWTESRRKA